MLDRGAESEAEHQKILVQLAEADVERLWLVGSKFRQATKETGFAKQGLEFFDNVEAVKARLESGPVRGFIILIKGSNSLRLYELSELFSCLGSKKQQNYLGHEKNFVSLSPI